MDTTAQAALAKANDAYAFSVNSRRFPLNNWVCSIGDSITNNGKTVTSSKISRTSRDWIGWGNILANQRIRYGTSDNFAIGGQNTSDLIRDQLSLAINHPGSAVIVSIGTNDCAQGVSPGTIIANLLFIVNALRSAGKVVILCKIFPRLGWTLTGAARTLAINTLNQVNQFIAAQGYIDRVTVFDAWPAIAGPTDLEAGGYDALLYADGLHFNTRGAFEAGRAFAPVLVSLFPMVPAVVSYGAGSLYNVTDNPYGNRLINGPMQGTTGSLGTAASGTVPTSWIALRTQGSTGTITGSSASRTDTRPGNQAAFSVSALNGAASEGFVVQQLVSSGVTPGQLIQGAVALDVSGQSNAYTTRLRISARDSNGTNIFDAYDREGFSVVNTDNWSGVLMTDAFVLPANAAQLLFQVETQVIGNGGSAGTVIFKPSAAWMGTPFA